MSWSSPVTFTEWSTVGVISESYVPDTNGWDVESENPDGLDHFVQVGVNTFNHSAAAAYAAYVISSDPNLGDGTYVVRVIISETVGSPVLNVWLGDAKTEDLTQDGVYALTVISDFSTRPEIRIGNSIYSTGNCNIELVSVDRQYAQEVDRPTSVDDEVTPWTETSSSTTWTSLSDNTTSWT